MGIIMCLGPSKDGMVLHQSMMDDVVICLCTEPNCKTKVLELFHWRLRHSFSVLRHALAMCQEQWEYFLELCGTNSGCKVSPLALNTHINEHCSKV